METKQMSADHPMRQVQLCAPPLAKHSDTYVRMRSAITSLLPHSPKRPCKHQQTNQTTTESPTHQHAHKQQQPQFAYCFLHLFARTTSTIRLHRFFGVHGLASLAGGQSGDSLQFTIVHSHSVVVVVVVCAPTKFVYVSTPCWSTTPSTVSSQRASSTASHWPRLADQYIISIWNLRQPNAQCGRAHQ